MEVSDGWVQVQDDTGDWAVMVENRQAAILVPTTDFRAANSGQLAGVNNVSDSKKHLGCVLCVLADFKGQTVVDLVKELGPSKIDLVKSVYSGQAHRAGEILDKVSPMGIISEEFASYQKFKAEIEKSEPVPAWEGALGFGYHIVRASWRNGRLSLSDPQLGVDNPAIPLGVPVTLYTFDVGS